eukprot:m.169996 g.169996  ORF g.169996 m.169996 type:complete len:86 (-) comp15333_c0_seq2:93-350(-)
MFRLCPGQAGAQFHCHPFHRLNQEAKFLAVYSSGSSLVIAISLASRARETGYPCSTDPGAEKQCRYLRIIWTLFSSDAKSFKTKQ